VPSLSAKPKTSPFSDTKVEVKRAPNKKEFDRFNIPTWIVTDFALHQLKDGPWGVPAHAMVTKLGRIQSIELIKNPAYRLPLLALRAYQVNENPSAADRTALHAIIGAVDPNDMEAVVYFEKRLARIESDRAALLKPAVRDTHVGSTIYACSLFFKENLEDQIPLVNKVREIAGLDKLSLTSNARNLKGKDRSELSRFMVDNYVSIKSDPNLAKFLVQVANLALGFDLQNPVDFLSLTADRVGVSANRSQSADGHPRRLPKASEPARQTHGQRP
jgi:hypothetical protein